MLELDETHFESSKGTVTEYELEIELRPDDRSRNLLDEYIHDKFCWLDIPEVLIPYPPKVVRAYAHAGLMGGKVLQQVEKAKNLLDRPHKGNCERCAVQEVISPASEAKSQRSS